MHSGAQQPPSKWLDVRKAVHERSITHKAGRKLREPKRLSVTERGIVLQSRQSFADPIEAGDGEESNVPLRLSADEQERLEREREALHQADIMAAMAARAAFARSSAARYAAARLSAASVLTLSMAARIHAGLGPRSFLIWSSNHSCILVRTSGVLTAMISL